MAQMTPMMMTSVSVRSVFWACPAIQSEIIAKTMKDSKGL